MEGKSNPKLAAPGLRKLAAEVAGVSTETVRKVLGMHGGVSLATQERVLLAVTQVKRKLARKQGRITKLLNTVIE